MQELLFLFQTQNSDSSIVSRYTCDGCLETVTIRRTKIIGGRDKGMEKDLPYGCKCEDLAIAAQIKGRRTRRIQLKQEEWFQHHSTLNESQTTATFDTYVPENQSQQEAKLVAMDYANNFTKDKPQNLLLSGSYGLGKSHLALSVLHQLISAGHSGIFVSVPALLTKLKATYKKDADASEDEVLEALIQTEILALDDLGAEHRGSEGGSWATSVIFQIIDMRIGKPTIYTTNLDGGSLRMRVGERNFSRLMYNTKSLKVTGTDRRIRHLL
ncbi:ATP-binding protein [Shouchella shacheensis]|uniref:ATP-binding protein n=1 Tax=Shouchella shacheensis TaxID=1649580 RepID=UPI000AF82964|nr:ATP-binding protein [Shouchella shacheensis]